MIIAIDGPAGAGKSTVARAVARALGLELLDTGAMYRAVALAVLARGIDPSDAEGCARVARSIRIDFDAEGRILVDGQPGEPAIRGAAVTRAVSAVSAHPGVRAAIVPRQRARAGIGRGIVAEGRDIGSVVFPDADFKFFLTATPEIRAARRAAELSAPERAVEILEEIRRRDRLDTTRADSPLVEAPGSVRIDTDPLDVERVAGAILARVRADSASQDGSASEEGQAARATRVYLFIRFLDRVFCRVWLRLEVEGMEHIPPVGGALLAANHASYLDILVVAAAVHRHVTFVARDTLAEWWWLAFVMRKCGAILLRRGTSDRAALRAMAAHLSVGDLVAIYPEGTRSRDGRVGTFKGGAVMAARLAGVPLIPVGIRGAYQAWPRGRLFPLPRPVAMRFGPAIDPTAVDARERLEEAVRSLMADGTHP